MSPDLPPSASEPAAAAEDHNPLEGCSLELRFEERLAILTLPSPSTEARIKAAREKRAAHADWERRRELAIQMKRDQPERSIASIAREMNLSASSLGKWIRDAARAA